jgi:hypothetical protein
MIILLGFFLEDCARSFVLTRNFRSQCGEGAALFRLIAV